MSLSFDRTMGFLAIKSGRYSTHPPGRSSSALRWALHLSLAPLQDYHVASGGVTDSGAEVEQVIALSISEGCVLESPDKRHERAFDGDVRG